MYYLGIDLGGTNIAVGIVDENNQIIARASSKTKTDNAEQVADAMAETVYAALKNAGITLNDVPWVGLGSPGTINKAKCFNGINTCLHYIFSWKVLAITSSC